MPDLREQLDRCFRRRVCLVGTGNVDRGDDGFGVRLAERLATDPYLAGGGVRVRVAGVSPERPLGELEAGGFDHVVFVDAVDFGGEPGAVVWLSAGEMAARFPQISTHRISLGTLAQAIEAGGTARVWLLGVQPASLRPATSLSPAVQGTLEILSTLLADLAREHSAGVGSGAQPVIAPTEREASASPC